MGLTRLEALQVKQQPGEFIAAQDILVIEGELQDILYSGQAGRGNLSQGRHPEETSPPATPAIHWLSPSQRHGSGSGRSHSTQGHCSCLSPLSGRGWEMPWAATVAHSSQLWTLRGWGRSPSFKFLLLKRLLEGGWCGRKEPSQERRLPRWQGGVGDAGRALILDSAPQSHLSFN